MKLYLSFLDDKRRAITLYFFIMSCSGFFALSTALTFGVMVNVLNLPTYPLYRQMCWGIVTIIRVFMELWAVLIIPVSYERYMAICKPLRRLQNSQTKSAVKVSL